MHNPDGFTRIVSFDRFGLETDVEPLTVHASDQLDFTAQIAVYAQHHLAPTTTVQVEAHPDAAEGTLHAQVVGKHAFTLGPRLGQITVSLPQDDVPLMFLEEQISKLQSRRARVLEERTGVPF
ncbi:hypothetical protein ACFWTE_11450 [Nocardiopsis sp. NPDC058631]|uniref:hypothetical protein n=1 Tax=Nocardiopsis sp. NPDC058631 TaxID=3346566 RepID=UPI0036472349